MTNLVPCIQAFCSTANSLIGEYGKAIPTYFLRWHAFSGANSRLVYRPAFANRRPSAVRSIRERRQHGHSPRSVPRRFGLATDATWRTHCPATTLFVMTTITPLWLKFVYLAGCMLSWHLQRVVVTPDHWLRRAPLRYLLLHGTFTVHDGKDDSEP